MLTFLYIIIKVNKHFIKDLFLLLLLFVYCLNDLYYYQHSKHAMMGQSLSHTIPLLNLSPMIDIYSMTTVRFFAQYYKLYYMKTWLEDLLVIHEWYASICLKYLQWSMFNNTSPSVCFLPHWDNGLNWIDESYQ